MNATPFNPKRWVQVRELNGWNRADLADKLEILEQQVTLIEGGQHVPDQHLLKVFSMLTSFPVAFLFRSDPPELPRGSLDWH